jgi:RHS repeat-associated protein
MKNLMNLVMLVVLILQSFSPVMEVFARDSRQPLVSSLQQEDSGEETAESPTPPASSTVEMTPQEEPTLTPTATLTFTHTPPASSTAEMTPAEAFTETPEVTLSPTETSTPVVLEDEQEENPPGYEITLRTSPEFITPGGLVNLQWQVKAEGLEEFDLLFVLPYGVTVKADKKKNAGSEQPLEIYRIPAQEKGTLHLEIGPDVEMPVVIQVFLLSQDEDDEALLRAVVEPQAQAEIALLEKVEIQKKGGRAVGLGGKVKVTFPDGALRETAEVFIHHPMSFGEASPYGLSGRPFEIKARSAADNGRQISEFLDEVRIEVDYSYLNLDESLAADLALYWYNEEIDEWEALPSWVDSETQTLHASTNHFTIFDVNIHNWQASRLPTLDNFQAAGFTGAATFSLPIEVPPGPGGLQPSLNLSYNSQVIDQSLSFSQASWAGMGWSLDTGMIERNTKGTTGDTRDDTFFLTLNGVSSMIVRDSNGYHLADENFWKIQKQSSPDRWIVWDKIGNIYYFEYTARAAHFIPRKNKDPYYYCGMLDYLSYQWHLTRVRNVHGKELTFTYTKETKTFKYDKWDNNRQACRTTGESPTDTAVYPHTIVYPHGRYRVRFELQDRADYKSSLANPGVHESFMRKRLSNIYVEQDSNGNGAFDTVIRRYALTYAANNSANLIWPGVSWTAGGKTSTLVQVREYGLGGQALPPHTFTYGDNMHLTRAENGYGGAVEFDYQPWVSNKHAPRGNTLIDMTYHGDDTLLEGLRIMRSCQPNGVGMRIAGFPNQGSSRCDWYGGVKRYGLEIRGINVSTTPEAQAQTRPGGFYRISGAIVANSNSISFGFWDGVNQQWQPVSGNTFKLDANRSKAELLISATGTNNWSKVDWAKMELVPAFYRVTQKRVYDGQGNQYPFNYTYQGAQVNHTGLVNAYCPLQNNGSHAWLYKVDPNCREYIDTNSQFRGHSQVTETAPNGLRTITQYHQGDVLKGRPISVTVTTSDLTTGLLSQKFFKYVGEEDNFANAVYPVIQPIWAGNCTNCPSYIGLFRAWVRTASQENRVYASDGSYSTTREVYTYEPTYGNQTRVDRQEKAGDTWQTAMSLVTGYYHNLSGVYLVGLPQHVLQYNAQNNLLGATHYAYDGLEVGQAPVQGKLTTVRNMTELLEPDDRNRYQQSSYEYDAWGNRTIEKSWSGYGKWNETPTQGERATTTQYDPTYHTYPLSVRNPLNQTVSWTYNYSLGLPISQSDPNGAVTSATYDNFGRLKTLVRPGDDSANPTIKVDYFDTANPFRIEISQRIAGVQYLTLRHQYDGMGRQFKTETGSTTNNIFSLYNTTQTLFDSPTKTRQSLPFGPGETPAYTSSETVYQGGKKTSSLTAPDGSQTTTVVNGLTTTLTDSAGRVTISHADVWGRTVSVTPPTGPGVDYTYDLLGRLLTAMHGGATTSLAYDMAGRKIAMSDPDMGNWTYAYDALGNLTGQTDARGCTLSLTYDLLNRLTAKNSAGNCGTQVNTSYTYDAGTNSKGRRTGMQDDSGATTWAYDERGRLASEIKTIDGQPYVTAWTYNSADLPATMTYPDGEVVTNTYDANALLKSVSGTDTYVQFTDYDSAGRMTNRRLGDAYPPAPPPVFSDVLAGHWAQQAIEGLYSLGIVGHCATNPLRYCPDNQVSRARVAVDILRAKYGGSYNPPTPSSQRFDDVPTSHWAYKWIDKFAVDGMSSGCGSGNFCPDSAVNRAQMAVFLLRAKHGPTYNPPSVGSSTGFNDVPTSHWAAAWIKQLAAEGISSGCGGGNFCPDGIVTRAMEATLIENTFRRIPAPVSSPVIEQTYSYYAWNQQGGRLKQATAKALFSNTTLQNISYQYDGLGNLTRIQNPLASETHQYTYDALDRLTGWTLNSVLQETYTYDPATGNLLDKGSATLAYTDPAHVHAATSLSDQSSVNSYQYDANGNQVTRDTANGGQYQLFYDAENRLVQVKKDGVTIAQFTYDGDGRRVIAVENGETTRFIGGHYEVKGSEITKYYFAGASRIAVRKYTIPVSSTLEFILGDHLGSTSLTTDSAGTVTAEMRYTPWGEVRYTSGIMPTDYTYTGQYSNVPDFGLMFYNARWYDPQLGRFAQADTIIPLQTQGTQAWDRYAYVNNNPLKYTDPSGHEAIPWWETIKFLLGRAWENGGKLSNQDWAEAADTYAPASHKGANISISDSLVVSNAAFLGEGNIVTTDDGEYGIFMAFGGGGALGLPGFSTTIAQGYIDGNFETPEQFTGLAGIVTGTYISPYGPGVSISGWSGLNDDLSLSGIYGYDAGISLGTPGGSVTGVLAYAQPAGDFIESALEKLNLADTPGFSHYAAHAKNIQRGRLEGVWLFACRAANQCGRDR